MAAGASERTDKSGAQHASLDRRVLTRPAKKKGGYVGCEEGEGDKKR